MSQPSTLGFLRPWPARGWLLAALLIALGGAGIASGADHQPGDATRPELTWRADAELATALAALEGRFTELSGDVGLLAGAARSALVDLVGSRANLLQQDLARGAELATSIEGQAGDLRGLVDSLPALDRPGTLGERSLARVSATREAITAVEPLPDGWRSLAEAVAPAVRIAGILAEHDRLAFEATQNGTRGRFSDALSSLDAAAAQLRLARVARDTLAAATDVSTLSTWIDVAAAYDDALASLYTEMKASKGTLTDKAMAALDQVDQAQRRLPADTRALVVILDEIARGGLNQGAIAIEQARGDLAAAIAALH
jgi:hypothetical protein